MPTAPATLDLNDARFDEACRALADAVHEYRPDVVVGIATGGAYVAHQVAPHLHGTPAVAEVELRRPSTEVKQRVNVGPVLRVLPAPVRNLLRWLEVELRELALRRRPQPSGATAAEVATSSGFDELVATADRALVIDDTVDSGRTLVTAVEAVRTRRPSAEIRTAVLTSTFRKPPVRPDYCLHDRTLMRFPWSFDS